MLLIIGTHACGRRIGSNLSCGALPLDFVAVFVLRSLFESCAVHT